MTDPRQIIEDQLDIARTPCVTCSFQADGVVLLHMLKEFRPDVPVLFIDTFHHFEAVYRYRDEIAERWGLNLLTLRAAEPARGLWQRDTDACCARHKVEPLFEALAGYDAWFTALRRSQSPSRAKLKEIEPFTLPGGRVLRKVNPLATWSTAEVRQYARAHGIPLLPLYELGYTSIGCEPCTSLPLDPSDERSGRWNGRKLECGIHVQPALAARGV